MGVRWCACVEALCCVDFGAAVDVLHVARLHCFVWTELNARASRYHLNRVRALSVTVLLHRSVSALMLRLT